ncbi:MAG: hypothetical protein RL148_1250 [Planctomycetota bacterium]
MLTAPACVFQNEDQAILDVNANFASAYVFRGQTMTEKAVFQPDARASIPTVIAGNANFGAFANVDLTDEVGDAWFDPGHSGEATEFDLIASYSRDVGPVTLEAGAQYYNWPNHAYFPFQPFDSTTEAFASAGTKVLGVKPSVTAFYDVDEVPGAVYVRGEVNAEVKITKGWWFEPGVWLGWSDDEHSEWLYRKSTTGFSDAGARLQVAHDLTPLTTLRVGVHASTIVDETMRDWFVGAKPDPDVFWFTAGISFAF